MSVSLRLCLAIGAMFFVTACGRPPPAREAPPEVPPPRPTVTVLNADILVVDGLHVRLSNAFAPEQVPDARCWAEALAAKQAKRTVQAMIDRAAAIAVTPSGTTDEFNRTLARVTLDGADLGDLLFEEGLAARPKKGRFEWCNPLSRKDDGAPRLWSMIELAPGKPPGE